MLKQPLITLLLFLFGSQVALTQRLPTDTRILSPKISKFIPDGYAVLDTIFGDLNLDKYRDVVLVLKAIGEETATADTEYKRPLLLLLGHRDKTFTLAARNDDVVYCRQCGGVFGDPYDGVEIKKGVFTVNHFGGSNDRWSNEITFKYLPTDTTWYLYKIVDKGWNVFHLDKVETRTETKKDFGVISFERYKNE